MWVKFYQKELYKNIAYNDNVKGKNMILSLLTMLDMSILIYIWCGHYVMSHYYKEKNGLSPFVIIKRH